MMNILLAIDFENLHTVLRSLYDEMMPLCANMAGVARAIAGLGALFYIAYRVWQSLARAEAIDVFPLLRPFAIGLCILMFPTVVLGTLNAVMTPIVQGVATMLEGEKLDMQQYREQKDKLEYEAMKRNPETAYLVSNEEFDKQLEELGWSPGDHWSSTSCARSSSSCWRYWGRWHSPYRYGTAFRVRSPNGSADISRSICGFPSLTCSVAYWRRFRC